MSPNTINKQTIKPLQISKRNSA
uniref:Uncharacterized protein n=1 Tax=Rhizophora mucronata TaxID=61149 RepID=A0A2P2IY34_RHIMU